jgi:hypothetical protein
MKRVIYFLLFITSYSAAQTGTSLRLNEIMFYPSSGNNEFIELYNTSSVESIDLNGFRIKYYTLSSDTITDAGEGTILPPLSYAVILEGDYDFVSGIYNNLIPQEALIVKISDNSFGSTGMSNTSDRPIWLLSASNDTVDVYTYSADNSQTHSDEKIYVESDSSQVNWANSIPPNGTPGFRNSVTPLAFDLAIERIAILPEIPIEENNISIEAVIKNFGQNNANIFTVQIFNDTNLDSIPQANEQIFSQQFFNLNPDDSVSAYTNILSAPSGFYNIIAEVIFSQDEDTSNNTANKGFTVYSPGNSYNDVVINEIMYAPSTGEPEWVEIYNRTSGEINLNKWKFSDNVNTVLISNQDKILPAESFLVLTKDSSILNYYSVPSEIIQFSMPALNNSGDAVVIKDSLGIIIDSLIYSPGWGGQDGMSLERINFEEPSTNPNSWATSISRYKGTPGYLNSVSPKDYDISVTNIIPSPPFPVFGDNVALKIKVKNYGMMSASYSLNLYEDTNRDSLPDILLKTISNLVLQQADSSAIESGYIINNIQNGHTYYAEAVFTPDLDTSNNHLVKDILPGYQPSSIIINELMYAPTGGEPEWVEIYNTSDDSINLIDWSVNDVITTPTYAKVKTNAVIPPANYLVITKDSSILNYHRILPSPLIKINLPVLNNDADGFVLKDSRGQTMDSVFFSSTWGGTNGNSLERISASASSNLSSNWDSSEDIESGTPGRINSITPKTRDIKITKISSEPEFPVAGDNVFISVTIKNKGSQIASGIIVEFYLDSDSNNVIDQLLSSQSGIILEPEDSVYIISGQFIQNLSTGILTAVRVNFQNDEDTLNNYAERLVQSGFANKSLLINEIMYNPVEGEPEWFELINNSPDSINLKNWSASDLLTTPLRNFITTMDFYMQPDQFVIVAKDTSFYSYHPGVVNVFITNFGTLGNSEDGVILYDFRDAVIDSVHYKSKWGGKHGCSLERISFSSPSGDSSNWVTCLSSGKSTPGMENSILNILSVDRNSLVINEIMYDPGIDNCEFIEFYNNSTGSVNIGGWSVEDEKGNSYRLSDTGLVILPEDYFILAADSVILKKYSLDDFKNVSFAGSSSLGLSNEGELILLKDARGLIIDSVFYSSDWNNRNINVTKNKSLERINPGFSANYRLNWSTCVNPAGATPGKQNSIYTINSKKETGISVSPNPFSPDNDAFEDFCIINYSLTQVTSQIRIKIFDNRGRLVRTLANNQPSASSGSVIFDGLGDDGQPLRIGIYIVFLEALNDSSGVVENLQTVVVIARKL